MIRRVKSSAPTSELPRTVEDALAGASYMLRAPTEDGHRVMLSIVGLGHLVIQDTADLDARITRAWPELNDRQVARVVTHINAGARAAIARAALPGRSKKRWLDY